MILFNPARLRAANHWAGDNLAKIADIIKRRDLALGVSFEKACQNYDHNGADEALTTALTALLDNDANDCLYAFEAYCNKFGLKLDFTGMSDAERIQLLASHQAEIRKVLDEKGV